MPNNHDSSYQHQDQLAFLNQQSSLHEKLIKAHLLVQESQPDIARIALALYDADTKILKTFLHSSGEDNPLEHYATVIDNAPSLREVLERGQPRVINNLVTYEEENPPEHIKRLGRQGYAASYTVPMFDNGEFFGFLFFNSYKKDVFNEGALQQLDLHAHIIALMVVNELNSVHTLSAVIKSTGHISHHRDPETGSHLDRMSRYTRLIAMALADDYELSDDFIEHVFMFSPLHDIGKIAIPDQILLKPARLDEDEMRVMKDHTVKGRQIIDNLIENFGLGSVDYTDIMRNIATDHHEAVDGSGYPLGKRGEEIPLEARIVAVADIFDALTSQRPYKRAWSNDEAFDFLKTMAGKTLDPDCVEALCAQRDEVEKIQATFQENTVF